MSTDDTLWCRLCAKEDGAQVDVFREINDCVTIADVIEKFFSVTILACDKTSKMICFECWNYLEDLMKFSDQCLNVQKFFLSIMPENSSVKSKENLAKLRIEHDLMSTVIFPRSRSKMCNKSVDTNDLTVEYLQMGENMDDHLLTILVTKSEPEEEIFEAETVSEKSNRFSPDLNDSSFEIHEHYIGKVEPDHLQNGESRLGEDEESSQEPDDCDPTYVQPLMVEESDLEHEEEERLDVSDEVEINDVTVVERKPRIRRRTRNSSATNLVEQGNQCYKCDQCEKSFFTKSHFRQHLQNHVPADTKFNCSKCSKSFATEKRLQHHEGVHLPPEMKRLHPCPYCDKKFTKSANVQAHVRAIHIGEKPFICEKCGKSFGTRGALKEHKYTHIDETPYQCSHCPKKFKNMARLKTHEDIHNNTMYVCPSCGLQLNTKRTLQMHMVVHSDQKKYKCQFCGNEYKRSKALKNHLILHTGLRPYMCPFCDKTFANGSNCRSHKKKAHPIELAAMEAAGESLPVTNIPKLAQLKAQSNIVNVQPVHSKQSYSDANSVQLQSDQNESYNAYGQQISSTDFSEHHTVLTIDTAETDQSKSPVTITHEFHSHTILTGL